MRKWGVWATRYASSLFGFAETWSKEHGERIETTEDDARERADRMNAERYSKNVSYEAREILD